MRFFCSSCSQTFEAHSRIPRCPQCLRQHGIEETDTPASSANSRPRLPKAYLLIFAVGIVITLTTILLLKQRPTPPTSPRIDILDTAALTQALKKRGIPQQVIVNPLESATTIQRMVDQARVSGSVKQRLRQIVDYLAPKLASIKVNLSRPVLEPIRTAETFAADVERNKVKQSLSFELALWVVAMLRTAGCTAALAETYREDNDPVHGTDITGMLGHFIVAVYADTRPDGEPSYWIDPVSAATKPIWMDAKVDPTMVNNWRMKQPIGDTAVAAHFIGLRALRMMQQQPDHPERAYELGRYASKAADATSANVHLLRAQILSRSGGLVDAIDAAEKAYRLRADSSRRSALAKLLLIRGDIPQAQSLLQQTIEQDPSFWPAHRLLVSIYWMQGNQAKGAQHLKSAAAVADEEPSVMGLRVSQHFALGETEQALLLLQHAAERDPSDDILLQLYAALLRLTKQSEAEHIKKQLLKQTPHPKQVQVTLRAIETAIGTTRDKAQTNANSVEMNSPAPPISPSLKLPDVSLSP